MDGLTVNIKIWGKDAGVLAWDRSKGTAMFQFNAGFLRTGLDIAPVTMPASRSNEDTVYQFPGNKNECFRGLPGLIADSLPDNYGNDIINEWFAVHGLPNEEITPLDRLCYIGARGMGALEFEPSKHIKELDTSTILHISELTKLADKVFNDRSLFKEQLQRQDKHILDILKVGTSAGGAKPKAIIAWNERTNEIRSGQVKAPDGFTYWLLKFDGTTYAEHEKVIKNPQGIGNIEYAYYKMATDAGIHIMESRLIPEGDNCHFMTKRFDRYNDGGKLHVQTLAAIAHLDKDTRHSYEEMFGIMRKLRLDYTQQEELFRRMTFNVVARNHDDHTKNHAFLMHEDGTWELGPAYDICYSYVPGGMWTNQHQMSLNGKREGFTFADLESVGKQMGINKPHEIIEKTVQVVSKWDDYAQACGVREAHRQIIARNLLLLNRGN
ncbi:MAG: type II toxin-antitoxin system HipA family toxin [Prevotellaceae bacterium]|nr:type II toxin-antitoxin system HipA family toxin [Prevotellaceae bacterium]